MTGIVYAACDRAGIARAGRTGSATPRPAGCSREERASARSARRPGRFPHYEHVFKFIKRALGLTAAKVRTPEHADRWARVVMAAWSQLLPARPLAADLRRLWENSPVPAGR
ncbi:MAG: hypothetical protein ABSA93_31345 [Streptosporangiaceae bacterium]